MRVISAFGQHQQGQVRHLSHQLSVFLTVGLTRAGKDVTAQGFGGRVISPLLEIAEEPGFRLPVFSTALRANAFGPPPRLTAVRRSCRVLTPECSSRAADN